MSLLLQLRVLRLGFLQDGDVGVGVFQADNYIGITVNHRRSKRAIAWLRHLWKAAPFPS